jgi:hypothetical protein
VHELKCLKPQHPQPTATGAGTFMRLPSVTLGTTDPTQLARGFEPAIAFG